VLGSQGNVIEQGTFDHLRSLDGFVSKLLIHPELLTPDNNSILDEKNIPKAADATNPGIPKARAANDAADLTRQIGDTSVYIYYFRSIGWKISLVNVASSFVFALGTKFPCK